MPDPGRVRAMFGRIAGRYDLLNRLLSAGIDQRWRRLAVRTAAEQLGRQPELVVDTCCGTGDLALAFAEPGARVVGVDFTPEMLRIARPRKALERGVYVQGDAMGMPLVGGVADVVSIAFGLRNVADRGRCLRELVRLLRPGGVVLVLEFGMPAGRLSGALYRFYFTRVLPWIGGRISGDRDAYRYLPDTVLAWPTARGLRDEMGRAGLVDCGYRALTLGIAYLHWGRAPRGEDSDGSR